jgi:CHASE2 domain-containing sensor protein
VSANNEVQAGNLQAKAKTLLKDLSRPKFWVPFVLACLVVLAAELLIDHLVEYEELPGVTQSVFNATGLYQRILAAPRSPVAKFTTVVEIDPQKDSSVFGLQDICAQREMITRLLYIMAEALPREIVIDKYYGIHQPGPCPKDQELIEAVRSLRRNNIPVVVGRRVADEPVVQGSEARYFLLPAIEFDDPMLCQQRSKDQTQPCLEGVVNISKDTRKLPLEWMLFPSREYAEKGEGRAWHDTIALTAARAYDNKLLEHYPRLAHFLDVGLHPYVCFLKPGEFNPILVGQLLKPNLHVDTDVTASTVPQLSNELRRLSGKIVLVGEINSDLDSHASVVGRVPGLYLQANYIEALLDDRYYRPVPWLDYVLAFLILLALELILIVFKGRYWTMSLLILALFIGSGAIVYLLIKLPNWYVNPVSLGVTAIVIKLLNPLFGPAEKAAES